MALISRSRGSSPVASVPARPQRRRVRRPPSAQAASSASRSRRGRRCGVRSSPEASPEPSAGVVAQVGELTPEGTGNIVQVLAATASGAGASGSTFACPPAPRSSGAGSPASARRLWIRPHPARGRRTQARAVLLRDGHPVFAAPVGIGAPGTPTPRGKFYVRNRLTRYASPAYGPIAFGTSARSDQSHRLAGRRLHRHPRNRSSGSAARPGLARMYPDAQSRDPPPDRLMPVGTPLTIR